MSDNTPDLSPDIRRQLEQIARRLLKWPTAEIGTLDALEEAFAIGHRLATERAAQIADEQPGFVRSGRAIAAVIRGQEQR